MSIVLAQWLPYVSAVGGVSGIAFAIHRLRDPVRNEQRAYRVALRDQILKVVIETEREIKNVDLFQDVGSCPPSVSELVDKFVEMEHKLKYPSARWLAGHRSNVSALKTAWALLHLELAVITVANDPTGRKRASAEARFKSAAESVVVGLQSAIKFLDDLNDRRFA